MRKIFPRKELHGNPRLAMAAFFAMLVLGGFLIWWVMVQAQHEPGTNSANPPTIQGVDVSVDLTPPEEEYLQHLGKVRMCVDPDWEPYEHINERGEYEGIAADLMQIIAERVGVSLVLVQTGDWEESIAASKSGQCQILAFLNQTRERDEWLLFTEPYFTDSNVLITREEHHYVSDLTNLSGETIVFPAGTSVEERFRGDYPDIYVQTVESEEQAFSMVEARKADLTARSLTMAAYVIKKEGWFNLKIAGEIPNYTNNFRIGVVKDQPMLRNILNKGVLTLTPLDSQQIVNQHISITVQPPVNYPLIGGIAVGFIILALVGLLWNYQLRQLNRQLAARQTELVELSRRLSEDVAARQRTESALRESEQKYRLLADHSNDVIWTMTLEGQFTYVSPSVFQMRGFTPEEVKEQSLEQSVCTDSLSAAKQALEKALFDGAAKTAPPARYYEIEQPRKDGKTVWTEQTVNVVYDETGAPVEYVGVSRDITERRRLKDELQHQAITDELTGVINRRHFFHLAQNELKRAVRCRHPFTIIFIDIDRFKLINDTFGHTAGDQVLIEFARIFQARIREIDLFARIGGDEFALLLPEADLSQAYEVIERVRLSFKNQRMMISGNLVAISISSGIAGLEKNTETLQEILDRADQMLYQAKKSGRDRTGIASSAIKRFE